MIFITVEDYLTYNGITISAADFPRFAARASEAVDAATGWKLTQAGGLSGYCSFIQGQVKLACCAMCEYLYLEGEDAALDGASSGGGYHIGKASQTAGNGSSASTAGAGAALMLCEKAYMALVPTGLLYAGVEVWSS